MPKQKTHSASKKRFKISGTGKVLRPQAYKKHKAAMKSPKRRRTLRGLTTTSSGDEARIKQMIPYK